MSFSDLLNGLLIHPLAEKLGWTLLHFLWQGTAVAVIISLILLILRRSSANARYLVSCISLLLMAVLPIVTIVFLPDRTEIKVTSQLPKNGPDTHSEIMPTTGNPMNRNPVSERYLNQPDDVDRFPANPANVITTDVAVSKNQDPVMRPTESFASRNERLLRPWLPLITFLWLIGVFVLSIRLLVTWTQVQKLQTTGLQPADAAHIALLKRLGEKLGVRRIVHLIESSLIEVPTVIGWLKPVILLPIASVSSLTTSQLEAILLHELAHIRRADYAMNMLQSLIETLLFYHPAVWWLSSRIRQEREHCCDDLATTISGDKAGYIAALVRMEELRCPPGNIALAVRGGNLLTRVRRLIAPRTRDQLAPWWLTGMSALLIVIGIVVLPAFSRSQVQSLAADDVKPKAEIKPMDALADDKAKIDKPTDDLTPALVADKIEQAWKRYESIEYSATIEEARNTNAFGTDPKPILIKGTGSVHFIADANRWFVEEKSFSARQGTTEMYPRNTTSSFDGKTHSAFDGMKLVIGEEELNHTTYEPKSLFWQSGLSASWLLSALRRPEAKIMDRIKMSDLTCLHIHVNWKPEWDTKDRDFDIMICPEQNWLPRNVVITSGDEPVAEWSISSIEATESGLCYPVVMKVKRPESDNTPFRLIRVTNFRERNDLTLGDFAIPIGTGVDIVDHHSGIAWHNDPWWNEMAPWMWENILWPMPDMTYLTDLRSYCEAELFGKSAPSLKPSEWVTGPGSNDWDRPNRSVTILHFFGGRLISPTPRQLKALDNLHRKYRESGLDVIAVATHNKEPELTRQAVNELNLSFPVAIDSKPSEADLQSSAKGASWGATFAAFRQNAYVGTVVIDSEGKVIEVGKLTKESIDGLSPIETLIRDLLQKTNASADSTAMKQMHTNRVSRLLRGSEATLEELQSVALDFFSEWRQNIQQKIASAMPPQQTEFLKAHRLTVEDVLRELNQPSPHVPSAGLFRITEEWKRRASKATATGNIRGTVRLASNSQLSRCKSTIVILPEFRMLGSSLPGGWMVDYDRTRQQTIESDNEGKFQFEKLAKGTYQLSFSAPGVAQATRSITLVDHDSQSELNIVLSKGDTISGKVTDASGNPISNAKVKAIQRYAAEDNPNSYTTENLPHTPSTTSIHGEFIFESLYEGSYVFEVTCEGYEPSKTEKVRPGTTEVKVVLKVDTKSPSSNRSDREE